MNWLSTGDNGKNIPMVDSRYILKKAKDVSMIVDTSQDIECEYCDHVQEGVRMPMSIYFFWPEFEELSGVSPAVNQLSGFLG